MQRAGKTKSVAVEDRTIYYADVYDYLTLRQSASTDATEIGRLSAYSSMYVLENKNGMAEVYALDTGETGYVNADYITPNPYAFTRAGKTEASSAITQNTRYSLLCDEYVTLRDAPSTSGVEIRKVYKNEYVYYVEAGNSEFTKVQTENGDVGYIMSKYLSTN